MRALIGGVGYRWMRDASIGLLAADELARQDWPSDVRVDDLGYGAIYASQDIAAANPRKLILLAGVKRGRQPARIYRSAWQPAHTSPEDLQELIREAGAGVIGLDHLLVVGQHFEALPAATVLLEVEPVEDGGGDGLSAACQQLLPRLLARARDEALAPDPVPA